MNTSIPSISDVFRTLRSYVMPEPQLEPLQGEAHGAAGLAIDDGFDTDPSDTQKKLADVERRLSPAYTVEVDGKPVTVNVPAHFRMVGGYGCKPEDATKKMTEAIRSGGAWPKSATESLALKDAITRNAYGRATPEQVKLVTEHLIKSGALNPYLDKVKAENGGSAGPEQVQLAIRRMQWDHGVGIDCNGAVQIAYQAVNGKSATRHWGDALIQTDKTGKSLNPRFKQVGLDGVQPGDVIKLADPAGGVGHNVVVTNVRRLSSEDAQTLEGEPKPTGPLKAVTVFSSWGAGGNPDNSRGGVRKETWVYDEATKKWGTLNGNKVEWSTENGPYDHKWVGAYRGA